MGLFYYNNGDKNHHKNMIGVWLNLDDKTHIPTIELLRLIKKSGNKRLFDIISRVIIHDYEEDRNIIWVEIWCKNIIDIIKRKHRYNVFYITPEPNGGWLCHDDLGKGKIE